MAMGKGWQVEMQHRLTGMCLDGAGQWSSKQLTGCNVLQLVRLVRVVFISSRVVFISFHFMSFHFISCHFALFISRESWSVTRKRSDPFRLKWVALFAPPCASEVRKNGVGCMDGVRLGWGGVECSGGVG